MANREGKIYAVVLAAGFSSRLGFDKLTLTIDGEPVIRRAVSHFVVPSVDQVVVVVGRNGGRLREQLAGLPVVFAANDRAERGMSASVAAAIPFMAGAGGVIFHLGDKPFVRGGVVASLVKAFREVAAPIVAAEHRGRRGHPILVEVDRFLNEMRALRGDMGLREVIEKHSDDVICIEGGEECLCDIDTVEDIVRLRKRGYAIEKG